MDGDTAINVSFDPVDTGDLEAFNTSAVVIDPDTCQGVSLATILKDKIVVLVYFRRFGCMLCRAGAIKLSRLQPVLTAANVALVGIGFDVEGYKEFKDANYFSGKIYLDPTLGAYNAIGLKRASVIKSAYHMMTKSGRKNISDAYTLGKELNIPFDFKNDGFRLGATFIIDHGARVLHKKLQKIVTEFMPNQEILATLQRYRIIPDDAISTSISSMRKNRRTYSDTDGEGEEEEYSSPRKAMHVGSSGTGGRSWAASFDTQGSSSNLSDMDTKRRDSGTSHSEAESFTADTIDDVVTMAELFEASLETMVLPPDDGLNLNMIGLVDTDSPYEISDLDLDSIDVPMELGQDHFL